MRKLLVAITLLLAFAASAFADTTLSRDGDGHKMQGGSFSTIRSASIGTKGFKCFSTLTKVAWGVSVTSSETTNGAGLGFKMFYNGNEATTFPVSDSFYQWQNSPVSKSPTITSICLRGYSTVTMKTASGIFQ